MSERTSSRTRSAVMTLIAGFLLPMNAYAVGPEPVQPPKPNPVAVGLKAGFDVVFLRPLGVVVMAVGAAAFVPAVLLAAPMGRDGIDPALEIFILEPAKSLFQRPLGDF